MEAKCNFHLTYLGRGIYAELIKRDTPLQTCTESDTVTSLIIGTLTAKDHTINKLVHGTCDNEESKAAVKSIESEAPQQSTSYHDLGLGGTHRQTTSDTAKCKKLSKQMMQTLDKNILHGASVIVKLNKLNMAGRDNIIITKEMPDSMPKTKYSGLHNADTSHSTNTSIPVHESPPASPTVQHDTLMETILYWSAEGSN